MAYGYIEVYVLSIYTKTENKAYLPNKSKDITMPIREEYVSFLSLSEDEIFF